MTSLVEISHEDNGIALVTLNRPDAANALSTELLHCLVEGLYELRRDSNLRTVILTGAGKKAFCAGADLKERAGMNDDKVRETVKLIGDTITAVENLPVPVIAAINGSAFGGGLELALACDIRIASETAKVGLTETSLGIIPGRRYSATAADSRNADSERTDLYGKEVGCKNRTCLENHQSCILTPTFTRGSEKIGWGNCSQCPISTQGCKSGDQSRG